MYSFEEKLYKGNPVLELLEDREAIFNETGGMIKSLMFGLKKAKGIFLLSNRIKDFIEEHS